VENISVLLVEDNPGDARLLREAIREAEDVHIELSHHSTLREAVDQVGKGQFDIILLDLSLPDADGLETLVKMHTVAPNVPIVVLTGHDDEALAVRAVREGAQDYLVKGQVNGQLLVRAMRYANERKRAVEAIQRSEEYFRALIENALDVIAVLTEDTTIRYASPSFEKVLGYAPTALIGKSALPLIHPDDWESVRAGVRAGLESRDIAQNMEFRLRHIDGSWRVLEVIGKRLDSPGLSGVVLNARDITERKRAESSLRELNETLETVISTSPVAIYSVDLKGNVRTWNVAAERIFGFSLTEVINHQLPVIPPESMEDHLSRLANAAQGEVPGNYEAKLLRKTGSRIDVSIWSSFLRDATGVVTGVLFIAADNTESKRLEEQFRQSQKMEAVGRLAGGVAHDFNNLLTVITGYGQMMMDALPRGEEQEDLQEILRAADRASALTKQLLAFSRQQIVQPKVIDLNLLVADMDKMLRRLMGEDIEIGFHAAPEPAYVRIDPGQAEQVIVNLAVNARDAMPNGGKLTIETQVVHIDSRFARLRPAMVPGEYVLLAVCDNGSGIGAETLLHLFEPFFTTKEVGRGTGLGLSTSYGIVKQNQGDISVYSEPGIGTTFKIYLPRIMEGAKVSLATGTSRDQLRGNETVLVVEDEAGVRRVIVEMLEQQGYRVLTAENGEVAVELCRRDHHPIHLLITDVIMPRMSGRELADHLSALLPGLKVLFVSGYTDHAIIHHGVLEPGTHFLQKPFTPHTLAGKVREVLNSEKRSERGQTDI